MKTNLVIIFISFIVGQTKVSAGLSPEDYRDISSTVGMRVDEVMKDIELTSHRSIINQDNVDVCQKDHSRRDLFAEQISFFTALMFNETSAYISAIGSYYGSSKNEKDYIKTSLIKYPLCRVSKASLEKTLKNVPLDSTIKKIAAWTEKLNQLREESVAGDAAATKELLTEWTTLFACLGYTESLSSGDSESSVKIAKKNAPGVYRKPAAVKFYEDPYQPPQSRLNIGLYQFTPDSSGNVRPCMEAWNALATNKACRLNLSANKGEMIEILGSSLQSFNAFCGIHKIIQSFSIQINTNNLKSTHPGNTEKGKLKPAPLRCVSPFFKSTLTYNHFGPLQNSTGKNLAKLYSCIEKSSY